MVWCRVVSACVLTCRSSAARGLVAAAALVSAAAATPPLSAQLSAQLAVDEAPGVAQEPVVVYLVRHAEKAGGNTDDPPLSLAGQIRVRVLWQLIGGAALTHIHTTDFKRTRDTIRIFAEEHGIDPELYDPRELRMLADRIRGMPGTHLVVGHSNTTPVLVSALGGDPSDPIDELEYDRLYALVIQPDQDPVTMLLRFGEPYVEGSDFGLRADPGLDRGPLTRRRN